MNIILWLLIGIAAMYTQRDTSMPYWRENFFIEKELPKELRGKPIQYIDSVFQAKRKI